MVNNFVASTYEFLKEGRVNNSIIIVRDDTQAEALANVALLLDVDCLVLPDIRAVYGDDTRSFANEFNLLYITLYKYYNKKNTLLISPLRTILNQFPTKEYLQTKRVEFGDTIDINSLKTTLLHWGFTFVDVVESIGEVSFRGDIIDIYSSMYELPIRVSLFDDEVESIREFELETQISKKSEKEFFDIFPFFLSINSSEYEDIEKSIQNIDSNAFIKDISSLGFWAIDKYSHSLLNSKNTFFAYNLSAEIDEIYSFGKIATEQTVLNSIKVIEEAKSFKPLNSYIASDLIEFHKDKKITIIAKNDALLKRHSIDINQKFNMVYKDVIVDLISDKEIIISLNNKTKKSKKNKKSLILDELKPNDYVVHEDYGVGIFKGIEPVTVMGATNDFIVLNYLGDDRLLVPAQSLDVVDRYIANSGSIPMLDKLGKGSFSKNKAKIKTKLLEIASSIVDIAARRELIKGYKIATKIPDIELLKSEAGFVYTDDQVRSIKEIFDDLSGGGVMDRLLSGDVGFGKTEVAMNAIFVTAKSGYQSMFVAPTTLLSSQHYKSLVSRLNMHNIKVAKLDRFVSTKDKKSILQALEDGLIDVVIGTHSLFNAKFKKLALIIVDEEHKFGVKQKESLKALSQNAHLLSMSATPIPRTLNMALSTLKGMSQLLTPPTQRIGVRTYVKEFNENILKEVVLRELRRGGQIFYIFNSISAIDDKKQQILDVLPNLKIAILHSKISSSQTENIMIDFENKKYDMLLSTSIIESGIHIPNANSMLIDSANNFGIADLHQLRGRVGRGDKEGFCYFFVDDKDMLSSEATKRLLALENNSQLGSGHALAYQDLEIRGGGNILGESQSGHIKNIGYGLYLKMLEEAINLLSGTISEKKKDVDIKLSISAFISTELVSEDRVRLELYRRLSKCEDVNSVYEIEEEMIDRFGKIDTFTKQFLDIIVMKILSADIGINNVSSYGQNITFVYEDNQKVVIKANSKDEDDIVESTLQYLRKKIKEK